MRIRTRTLAFLALFAILTFALSAFGATGDVYHMQAIIGGGYGDTKDGGATLSPSGDITTDGTVKADTAVHVPDGAPINFGTGADYRAESPDGSDLDWYNAADKLLLRLTDDGTYTDLELGSRLQIRGVASSGIINVLPVVGQNSYLDFSPQAPAGKVNYVKFFNRSTASTTGLFELYNPGTSTVTFRTYAATGNTSIAGTLGVTGAATLSSTLGVTGKATMADAVLTKTISGAGSTLEVNYTPGTAGSGTLDSQALKAVFTPMDANDAAVERFAINAKIRIPNAGYTTNGAYGVNACLDMSDAIRTGAVSSAVLFRGSVGDNTVDGGTKYGTVNVLRGISIGKLSSGTQYNSGINVYEVGNDDATINYGIKLTGVGGVSSTTTQGISIGPVEGASGSSVYGIYLDSVTGGANNYAIKTNAGEVNFGDTCTATQFRLSDLNTAPASASATGTKGEVRITSTHIYVCVATNTWKRNAIEGW